MDDIDRVLEILDRGPVNSDLPYLVAAYAAIGSLSADADAEAVAAEHRRRFEEARAYLDARKRGVSVSDAERAARVDDRVVEACEAEARAVANSRKLRNLLLAVEHAINAVKWQGRVDAPGLR